MRDLTAEFRTILNDLEHLCKVAKQMRTPNAEDNEFVRAAIVGFSRHAPTEQWTKDHYDFVKRYEEGDYSSGSLRQLHGEKAKKMGLAAALCIGDLLGLFHMGLISEDEFAVAEAQLPGVLLLSQEHLS